MKQPGEGGVGAHNCDTCRTSFDCRTLATMIKVLEAHREEIENPELLRRFEAVKQLLQGAAWSYPEGSQECRYARLPREVQALTSELVRLWQLSHFRPRNGDALGTYQEEVRRD